MSRVVFKMKGNKRLIVILFVASLLLSACSAIASTQPSIFKSKPKKAEIQYTYAAVNQKYCSYLMSVTRKTPNWLVIVTRQVMHKKE